MRSPHVLLPVVCAAGPGIALRRYERSQSFDIHAITTATSRDLTGSTGRTYCFASRARHDGVTGAWSAEACTAVPLDDRSLKASSAWSEVTGSALYRGTALRTTRRGQAVSEANVEARRGFVMAATLLRRNRRRPGAPGAAARSGPTTTTSLRVAPRPRASTIADSCRAGAADQAMASREEGGTDGR